MTESKYMDSETEDLLTRIIENHPHAGEMRHLALAAPHSEYSAEKTLEAIRQIRDEIHADPIQDHYRRAQPAYDALSALGGFPTIANHDKTGWYHITLSDHPSFEHIGRPYTLEEDFKELCERVDRTIYAVTSYNENVDTERLCDAHGSLSWKGEKPTPGYEDTRAIALWGDIDLCDDLKGKRGELDAETLETAEKTLAAYGEAFVELIGNPDAVYALDSVGGSYFFTAPEATLPISDHFEGDDRARILQDLVKRSNNWFKDTESRINGRIEGANDVIDPDWANNVNRPYKAPLSIHADHDAVVTPLDPLEPSYELTPRSAVDDELITEATAWSESFTEAEHTDCVDSLVQNLWPDHYDGDWKAALEAWLEDENQDEKISDQSYEATEQSDHSDLTELDILHALSYIDPDCGYNKWMKIGFALADYYDDKEKALKRFTEWSKSGSEWDSEAPALAEKIIQNEGGTTNRVTIGTLLKYAKEGGWRSKDSLPEPGDLPELDPPEAKGFTESNGSLKCDHCGDLFVSRSGIRNHECDVEVPLTKNEVTTRTQRAIQKALANNLNRIIQSPPAAGKSYQLCPAIAKTDRLTTVLVDRGHVEAYDKYTKWAGENGLGSLQLPSFHTDCPTANGNNGDSWKNDARRIYNQLNISGMTIHENDTELFGRQLPCKPTCPYYRSAYGFDHENYDLLIGHPKQSYIISEFAPGRAVVFDEFFSFERGPSDWGAGDFDMGIARQRKAVNEYLDYADLPFDYYGELVTASADIDFPDQDPGFAIDKGHSADTPKVVSTLLSSDNTYHGDGYVGWFNSESENYEHGGVWLLQPPNLEHASAVIGLDATPTRKMWELSLDEQLEVERVLSTAERKEYLLHVLNNRFIEITGGTRPVGREDHIYENSAYAQFDAIPGECPIITSTTAKEMFEVTNHWFPEDLHFYSVKSSNEIRDENMAIIYGSPSRGDRYVRRWCDYAKQEYQEPERYDEEGDPLWENMGTGLDYGKFGNEILRQAREYEVFQAAMRAGRDTDESYIYIVTEAVPDWLPRVRHPAVSAYSDGERQVLSALHNQWLSADEVAEAVEISRSQVYNILQDFRENRTVDFRSNDGTLEYCVV